MSRRIFSRFFVIGLVLALLISGMRVVTAQNIRDSVPAREHDAGVAQKWMQLLYDRIEVEGVNPAAAARLYAYAGVTLYQSVLPGIPDGISLSGQLNELGEMPYPDFDQVYDWPSAANGALAVALEGLLSEDSAGAIAALRDSQTRARERAVDPEMVARSVAYGAQVGLAILDWSEGDRYADTRGLPYEPPTGHPSLWVPTREGMRAVEPFWGQIRPFGLYYADVCAQPMKMDFSTEPNSTFYLQALEVKTVGDSLTQEQKDIARFWVDTPGETGTPAGHWVMIENQMVDRLGLKLEMASMMYALVGVSLGDAFISSWSLKYQDNLLRPVTYINEYIDPQWTEFIQTPGFPEYPSGHSVVSGAAATVLTRMFGTVAFTDRSGRKHGFQDRSFTSFHAAASEAAISRIYGGIHFRAAIENGLRQGECVGNNILNYILLRPVPQGE